MKNLFLAFALTVSATAASADMGGVFLPDLTFPTPGEPTVSTQGCQPAKACTN